jgi:xanthine/CO dehydrogenase XdhC/CoxF family maturation factor
MIHHVSMSSLLPICSALETSPGQGAVLATLVKVVGSAYRRPGAMMLVTADGSVVGTISGGCLESDVRAHAERVLGAGKPSLLHYDLARDDPVWGLGMGCKADIDVLLEPLAPDALPQHLAFTRELERTRSCGVVATVFRAEGEAAPIGARLLLAQGPSRGGGAPDPAGDLASGPPHDAILAAAREALERRRDAVAGHRGPWGSVEVLYRVAVPPIALFACGGGDAPPLVRLAEQLGWHATQVRGDAQRTGLDAAPAPDARTAAVVMEHNYERDLALLRELLPSSAGYVGILGPRARTEQLLADLRARDVFPTDAQVARLHGPVGLDIGAESAEEVALAIAAEVQAVFSGREGGQLRRRTGAIHE